MMILHGNIHLLRPQAELDYLHGRSVLLPAPISPLRAWDLIMAEPQPVLRAAFRIRDAVSARFGVPRIGGFSGQRPAEIRSGDRLDFFLVEHVSGDALVLTRRDSHLSVMTCLSTDAARLTITTSVVTHNLFGRAYMLPVAPAHRLIVARMLSRLRRRMEAEGPA